MTSFEMFQNSLALAKCFYNYFNFFLIIKSFLEAAPILLVIQIQIQIQEVCSVFPIFFITYKLSFSKQIRQLSQYIIYP